MYSVTFDHCWAVFSFFFFENWNWDIFSSGQQKLAAVMCQSHTHQPSDLVMLQHQDFHLKSSQFVGKSSDVYKDSSLCHLWLMTVKRYIPYLIKYSPFMFLMWCLAWGSLRVLMWFFSHRFFLPPGKVLANQDLTLNHSLSLRWGWRMDITNIKM